MMEEENEDYVEKNRERRVAHTIAEQRRRDSIKQGIEQLQALIPGCHPGEEDSNGVFTKQSKAQILQKSIDYVSYLIKDHEKKKQEIAETEKKLAALIIMKENYEQLVNASDKTDKSEISPSVKFRVFQSIMTSLWEPFDSGVSVSDFQTVSRTVISWLEENCKPDVIKAAVIKGVQSVLG